MLDSKSEKQTSEANAEGRSYPLTSQQERVFFLDGIAQGAPLWNRVYGRHLTGPLDTDVLERAVTALIERHSVLRTRIDMVDGVPSQTVDGTCQGYFERRPSPPTGEMEDRIQALLEAEYQEPHTLQGGPLFRMILTPLADDDWLLVMKVHHVISDETTIRLLWKDLGELYGAFLAGEAPKLPPLDRDYVTFAAWQRQSLSGEKVAAQESYWLSQFEDGIPTLKLPTSAEGPTELSFRGAMERLDLPKALVKSVQSFSLKHRVAPFSTMLAAYILLLNRYTGQDDMVVGTVFNGRQYAPDLKPMAGFFANTVALRAGFAPDLTGETFVKGVHDMMVKAWEAQDFPLERLVERLAPERGLRHNPLFSALFNMVTHHETLPPFPGVQSDTAHEADISATQVELFLDVRMAPDASEVRIEYNPDLFDAALIQRMTRHFVTLLQGMISTPDLAVGVLPMLEASEREKISTWSQGETVSRDGPKTMVDLLEDRVARTPEGTAILSREETLTCAAFHGRVEALAARLLDAGVASGDVVAVRLERSARMAASLLAVARTGAAYLPIDPAFPTDRVAYILKDSGARFLMGEGDDLPASSGVTVIDPAAGPAVSTVRLANHPRPRPEAIAYVLYTSGSTGKPKGVAVSHGAAMNTLRFLEEAYAQPGKTILLKTNFTFDVSGVELFGWIFADGRLAVAPKDSERDPQALLQAMADFQVSHATFVPSLLDAFVTALTEDEAKGLDHLTWVLAAGEALRPDVANRFRARFPSVRLENLYGPTEAAIYATWYALPRDQDVDRVPIGAPLPNTRAQVLDDALRPVPVGVVGELYLSGAGLAEGYLNQPQLTAQRFPVHPTTGERLYRTGDLAKWGEDHQLLYLGRADDQVKIRGFRVELGEIESRMAEITGIDDAVVVPTADGTGLTGFYLTPESAPADHKRIRDSLAQWLPQYMVPDRFVAVDEMPRLPSGKVDRGALSQRPCAEDPQDAAEDVPDAATVSDLERTVIEIAENLLGLGGLTPSCNFFHLGGNSLLTLRFIAGLDEALGTRLSAVDFLRLPTFVEIAALIEPKLDPATMPRSTPPRPNATGAKEPMTIGENA